MLYVPRLAIQQSVPPILVETQKAANESFMRRLIQYSLHIINIYTVYWSFASTNALLNQRLHHPKLYQLAYDCQKQKSTPAISNKLLLGYISLNQLILQQHMKPIVNTFRKNLTGRVILLHAQGLFKRFSNKDSRRNHFSA